MSRQTSVGPRRAQARVKMPSVPEGALGLPTGLPSISKFWRRSSMYCQNSNVRPMSPPWSGSGISVS